MPYSVFQDLVPCVLISFEREHILMWRGQEWKSSILNPGNDSEDAKESKVDGSISVAPPTAGNGSAPLHTQMLVVEGGSLNTFNSSISPKGFEEVQSALRENLSSIDGEEPFSVTKKLSFADDNEQLSASESLSLADDDEPFSDSENLSSTDDDEPFLVSDSTTNVMEINETISATGCSNDKSDAMKNIYENVSKLENSGVGNDTSEPVSDTNECQTVLDNKGSVLGESAALSVGSETTLGSAESTRDQSEHFYVGSLNHDYQQNPSEVPEDHNVLTRLHGPSLEIVLHLMRQAVENGSAVVLDDATLDADSIYERSVAFAKSAPPGPVFQQRSRKIAIQKGEKKEAGHLKMKREVPNMVVSENRGNVRQCNRKKTKNSDEIEHGLDVVLPPQGSLKIDELAKLLA